MTIKITILKLLKKPRGMNFSSAPQYSLSGSFKRGIDQMPPKDQTSPGPIYNTRTSLDGHTYSIGKSERAKLQGEVTPAPTQYTNRPQFSQPQVTIPKANRNTQYDNQVPAPGWYQPNHNLIKNKSQTFTMGTKYTSCLEDNLHNPGPGDYETPRDMDVLKKSKSVTASKFSSARRFKDKGMSGPGIGKYNINHDDPFLRKKVTIGKAAPKQNTEALPGPSDYHIKSAFEHSVEHQPGRSLSIRFKSPFEIKDTTTFAFGKYFENPENALINRRSSQKYSIGKEERKLFIDKNLPGPTDYINDDAKLRNSATTVIPKAKRREYNDTIDNPGPGSYDNKNTVVKGGYTIGKSKSMANLTDTPGAGRYNLEALAKEAKGSTIGKGKRTSFASTNFAGVGDYDLLGKQQKRRSGGFSRADRFGRSAGNQPGPGDYHIHNIIGYKHKAAK